MAGNDKRDFGRETRDTVVKSTLTGVGLTVLAVAALSPAGFGGMIGSSVASALGNGHAANASVDPYAKLPPFPNLLSRGELDNIQGELAATAAAMEITRAATDDRIELVRELALHPNALTLPALNHLPKSASVAQLRGPIEDAPTAPTIFAHKPVAAAPAAAAQEPASASGSIAATPIAPISFADSSVDEHLELASLLVGDN
ncbi:MAG: hypothetical protein QM759_15065 [Terricaulis sp.]